MKKILIVDDEEDVLILLKSFLMLRGYLVTTTLSCTHGLETFYRSKPDIVLLDVNVGAEDGRMMCRSIKAQADHSHIPVILMSADAQNLVEYASHGAAAVIEKPFNLPGLLKILNEQPAKQ